MSRRRSIAALIAFLFLLPFVPQIPGVIAASSGKHGRVIDQATGKGVPDAFVIASAHYYAQKWHGSENERLYRTLAKTDANGDYSIPPNLSAMRFGTPGFSFGAHVTWELTAFKPPYTIAVDEAWWSGGARPPNYDPPSLQAPPAAIWQIITLSVEPITLKKASFSFIQAADYYARITYLGFDIRRELAREEVELRRAGNDFLRPKICGQPRDTRIEGGFVMGNFAREPLTFDSELRSRDPGYSLDSKKGVPAPRAGDLCDVMGLGWDEGDTTRAAYENVTRQGALGKADIHRH